ncbi:serine protease spb1 [Bdellovibrio sp. 22V]|uniref:serine protease spb1 n=1 Tax=Bdellovibrio TaxID=958 RepID=UPI002543524A|nr:serine protease spb1 [Bdellovibrio sp. 22V]WII71623.1 serine protease spb1 [Bdellovibrio sp. 22V]
MRISILFLFALSPSLSLAASCCGGGFSIPALILGDDKAQVTSTYSYSEVSDEVLANGKWLRRDDGNNSQTLKLEGALLLSEGLQTGISLPMIAKSSDSSERSSGVGDVSIYLGHETFAETTYSQWKPKGVTFLQLTLPTSPSVYDEDATTANEIRGRGFYSLGAGLALLKTLRVWDYHVSAEIHRSFTRDVSNENFGGNATVIPGWGTSQTLGVGWNRGDLRLGSALSFLYEEAISIDGVTHSEGTAQKNFTWGLSGSYMLSLESAITVSYNDQTLIGNPINSSLSKTINLSYQQRWPR